MSQTLTPRKRAAVVAADALMLLLGLYGTIFSFLTSFPLLVDERKLLFTCLAAGLAALVVFSLPKLVYRAALTILWLVGVGWTVWMNWDSLVKGALASAEQIGAVFARKIGMGLVAPSFPEETGNLSLIGEREVCTLLFILVIALLALALGWAVVRRRSFWLALLASAPFLMAPLTITVTPEWTPLMALVLFWAVGVLTRLVSRRDPWGSARLTFLSLPVTMLLLFLLGVFLPREDYKNAQWITDARLTALERASSVGRSLLAGNFAGGFSGLSGDSVEVDLDKAGPLRFTGRTVLRVESEITGHIYLRGFSAGRYGETGWEQFSEEEYNQMRDGWDWESVRGDIVYGTPYSSFYNDTPVDISSMLSSSITIVPNHIPGIGDAQPLNFPAFADQAAHPGAPARRFTIESVGSPTGYVYTPYQLSTTPERMSGAEFVDDAFLARSAGIWRYVLYARAGATPMEFGSMPDADAEAERAYRDFVYRSYLDIPEKLLPILTDLLGQADFEPMYSLSDGDIRYGHQELTRSEVAGAVADILHAFTEYDPETPVTPSGEDFVAYFLTQSHKGYCMHFASAATLMLRYLGIPARYTAGYTADVKAGQTVNVPDQNAHAWVEIYIDGYGWHPVEVTPGFSGSFPWTAGNTNTTPSPTPSHSARPSETPKPQPSDTPDRPAQEQEARQIDWTRLFDPMWLIPPAVLFVLGWLFHLRHETAANKRRKRFYSTDVNRAVIDMYVYSERLLRYHRDEEMNPLPEELGQKARFSTHTLTENERRDMLSYTTGLAVRTYYLLGWWHKLFFRYILGLY